MTDRTLRLRCACGWETSGTEDELVAAAIEHGRRIHNMAPTRDEVLAMIVPDAGGAPDEGAAPDTDPPAARA